MVKGVKRVNELGKFIKARRLKAKITQEGLGKLLEKYNERRAGSTVAGWERGSGNVPRTLLPALAEILDVPIDDILRAANLLQTTPRSRLNDILDELGVSDQEIEDNIELIKMIFKKKR